MNRAFVFWKFLNNADLSWTQYSRTMSSRSSMSGKKEFQPLKFEALTLSDARISRHAIGGGAGFKIRPRKGRADPTEASWPRRPRHALHPHPTGDPFVVPSPPAPGAGDGRKDKQTNRMRDGKSKGRKEGESNEQTDVRRDGQTARGKIRKRGQWMEGIKNNVSEGREDEVKQGGQERRKKQWNNRQIMPQIPSRRTDRQKMQRMAIRVSQRCWVGEAGTSVSSFS